MSSKVCGNHDEEESCGYGKDGDEVGFEADEGADGEEGDGLGGFPPGEETLEAVLEDEDYSDSAAEVSSCSLPAGRSAYLALKRRKLFVINGSEKLGRLIYFELLTSGAISNSSTSSSGMTCRKSLRRRRLARHVLKGPFMAGVAPAAHFVNRRSCSEYPYSLLPEPCSCSLSFNFELVPPSDSFSLSRLPLWSDDGPSLPTAITGIGSSRFANASAVYSSMISSTLCKLVCGFHRAQFP